MREALTSAIGDRKGSMRIRRSRNPHRSLTWLVLRSLSIAWRVTAPLPAAAQLNIVDEVKAGILAHDVGFLGHHLEKGPDVNLEMLFTPPDLLAVIGSPRPHVGADINTSGKTSDGYFGLTWGIMLLQNLFQPGDGLFANGSLGGAVHDGDPLTGAQQPPGRKLLGSRILFRESAELGY